MYEMQAHTKGGTVGVRRVHTNPSPSPLSPRSSTCSLNLGLSCCPSGGRIMPQPHNNFAMKLMNNKYVYKFRMYSVRSHTNKPFSSKCTHAVLVQALFTPDCKSQPWECAGMSTVAKASSTAWLSMIQANTIICYKFEE